MRYSLLRGLVLLVGVLLRLAPGYAQALRGTFSSGDVHALSIHADGTLWATGNNSYGQLGTPSITSYTDAWVQVGTATDWVQVAAGDYYSLGLKANGTLWAWGLNDFGQLGITTNAGTQEANRTPTQVGTERYTQIAAGYDHSLGLRADGALYAWGSNLYGQLGNTATSGTYTLTPTPVRVGTENYTQVTAGRSHNLALRADGTLYAWGINSSGQLGNSTNRGTENPNPTPTQVGTARYTQVVTAADHTLALRADGTLWVWGSNNDGRIGNTINLGGSTATPTQLGTDRYIQIAAGSQHSLGLRANGTLYSWGRNEFGQLGNATPSGGSSINLIPTQVGTDQYSQITTGRYSSLALRADGTLYEWGRSLTGYRVAPTATGTALPTRSTAAGSNFGLAVRADGTLWAWGDNTYGQLGDGTTVASLLPKQVGTDRDWVMVAAGQYHSLGLKADGSLYAWGANEYGQLGSPLTAGTRTPNPTPIQVGTDRYTRIAAGSIHSLGLRADGTLYAWGFNNYGQLGTTTRAGTNDPTPTPTQVGTDRYTQIAAGFQHSLGLRADGSLWAWGYNISGQLGNGGTNVVNAVPTQVGSALYTQTAAGGYHSLGLRADGTLYAWGANYNGQLGDGTTSNSNTPSLTPRQAGTGTYTQVAAGQYHSLGLRADGTLYTWGSSQYGQLGNGTVDPDAFFINSTPIREATAGTNWATLSAGSASFSSVVRTASGLTFASAGLNNAGQLGDGTTNVSKRFDRLRPLGTSQPLPVLTTGPANPDLSLYPNPTPGRATLRGAAPGASVLVLDALGRLVLRTTADATGTARLNGLPTGLYLVRSDNCTIHLAVE